MQIFMDGMDELLIQNNYQRVLTDAEPVSMYGKPRDRDLYLLNLINLQGDFKISLEQYEIYKEVTKKQFKAKGFDKIYLLNVYISDEIDGLYQELSIKTPNYDDDLVDFQWIVHLKLRELYIPKEQPDQFLEVNSIIEAVLQDKVYEGVSNLIIKQRNYYVTMILIGFNVLIWIMMEMVNSSTSGKTLVEFGAIFTPYVKENQEYYRLFTAMFLHNGGSHLFYNMFALYLFGSRIEKVIGSFKFITLYIIAGLAGSLLSIMTSIGVIKIAAGASGAIYGLQGAALFVVMRIRGSLEGISLGLLWLMTIGGLISGFTSNNIDNMAHIGGLITGYFSMFILAKRFINK
ncbi:MAG: rhomboid family intramembrane serine protease [Eubacteriales bacterium]